MMFDVKPKHLREMLDKVNAGALPHSFAQIGLAQSAGQVVLQWEVDGDVPPWGRALVTLHPDGTWTLAVEPNADEPEPRA